MRKRLLLILVFSLIGIRPLAAADTFLLWSPGSEGTPEQAEPLLESWMDYLKNKGLDTSLKAVYRNVPVPDGAEQLKKIKPVVGIISLAAYLALADTDALSILLQTRKLPSGDGSSEYVVVKNKQEAAPSSLILAEPLAADFVKKILLKDSPASYQNLPQDMTDQVLLKLKKVGQGDIKAAVLISDYQAEVLKQLPSDWAKNLTIVARSPKLPSPPLVLFGERKGSFPVETFQRLLLEMDQDPEGQQILHELRLNGFMKPDETAYEQWKSLLASPPTPHQ